MIIRRTLDCVKKQFHVNRRFMPLTLSITAANEHLFPGHQFRVSTTK